MSDNEQQRANQLDHFGGLPSEPDVRRLIEQWPHLEYGDEISYRDVERVGRCVRGTNRWNTVTNAWRRRVERNTGHVIGCVSGSAFVVMDPSARVEHGGAKVRHAAKSARRAYVVVAGTDRNELTTEELARADLAQRRAAMMVQAAKRTELDAAEVEARRKALKA